MELTQINGSEYALRADYAQQPSPLSNEFADFKGGLGDVLRSIEVTVQSSFHAINEADPPNDCAKIDLTGIREFMAEWAVKPEFKASAFGPELQKNLRRLSQIIANSRELYEKNKPEVEKIKTLETYYAEVQKFQKEVILELSQAERGAGPQSALPDFERLFQKPIKYLARVGKIASRLENFPLLFAISGQNVDAWVASGLKCQQKFRSISDATAKLVDNFFDLEADLEGLLDLDFVEEIPSQVASPDQAHPATGRQVPDEVLPLLPELPPLHLRNPGGHAPAHPGRGRGVRHSPDGQDPLVAHPGLPVVRQ